MGAGARPRVGITFSPNRPETYYEPYVRAVAEAGAEPVLVPATAALHLEMTQTLRGIDGLLLPGGWDVDPALYGESPAEVLGTTDPELDRAEIEAVTEAMAIELPVLGICRGQQVLNVALGGTLHQHVQGHDGHGQPRDRLVHPIRVERDSELARAAGGAEVMVNSLHHQAVKELGAGLTVTASSPDGVIEGVEHGEGVVAVQCHPEELVEKSEWAMTLLQRFVEKGGPGEAAILLSLPELTVAVEKGDIDTVVVAFTDMQGRLVGKRLHAEYFLEEVGAGEPIEGCNYLLALEMEMDPVPGYQIASWERGYGDFDMVPDMGTLRRIPWLEGTALVLSDVAWHDGSPVKPSPRQVLKAQVERARALGFEPMFGSELEFYLFKETYAEANARHFRGLTPSVPYILDYHILATSYDEPFIRAVRNGMQGAGLRVESSKGEAWPGQQEINFRFADAVTMADHHTIYKNGIKEIAQQHGCSVTFMAKPDHSWIGNSCHVHSSLWKDGRSAFEGESEVFKGYLAGQIAHAAELAVFLAPNVNSYKRYAAGSWAPTTLAWGYDNRTCGFRIVGHGQGLRTESRIPGADANPYLVFAALLAAGLHGIEEGLPLPPAFEGNAYESDVQRFPNTLRDGIAALESGEMARRAFGDEVVDHYLNYARTEQRLFDQVVTCYERERFFERG